MSSATRLSGDQDMPRPSGAIAAITLAKCGREGRIRGRMLPSRRSSRSQDAARLGFGGAIKEHHGYQCENKLAAAIFAQHALSAKCSDS
jgi:hypothetical protein